MRTAVVTLMWGNAWVRYGWKFAATFARYWPRHYDLFVVGDQHYPLERGYQIPLDTVAGYKEFCEKWGADPVANGKNRPAGSKVDENGVSWRHEAVKWMPQALAPNAALRFFEDGDIMVWFDADVVTTNVVRVNWIADLLGDADVACLQRDRQHSEIGFYAIKVSPRTRFMMRTFAAFYTTGKVFDLPEWHSAYVWDRALENVPDLKVKNLSPGLRGHVWPATKLAECTMHNKGKRKDA